MWVILRNNADWDCFRTLTSQEILKIQNPLLEEHCAFLEVSAIPLHNVCIFSLVDPASSLILVSQSSLSQLICTCTDHPNVFTLAQVASAKEHHHLHISSIYPSHMVAEIGTRPPPERISERIREQIVDAFVPQMAEQLLEVPKIIHQDRIQQQTVEQFVDRSEAKRADIAKAERLRAKAVAPESPRMRRPP